MHVLHVVSDIDESFGGPSHSVPQLVRHLVQEGVTGTIVFVETKTASRNSIVSQYDIATRGARLLGPQSLGYAPNLHSILREEISTKQPNLIHIHSMWRYNAMTAWKVSRSCKIPIVVSPRSNLYEHSLKKSAVRKRLARSMFVDDMIRQASFIHSTSDSETKSITAAGFSSSRIIMIPNGIELTGNDYSNDKLAARKMLAIDSNSSRPHILFLSRAAPRKRLEDLIDAISISAHCRRGNFELLICGPFSSRSYERTIREKVKSSKFPRQVHLIGMVRDARRAAAYAAADIFVLPTQFENFGLAIGEALSVGLPVVTTTGTPWRAAEPHSPVYLYEPGNVSALAAGLDHYIDALPTRREVYASNARTVAGQYTWGNIASSMASEYKSLR